MFLIFIGFTRLLNDISRFTELSIDILTKVITFSLSSSARSFKRRKMFLHLLKNLRTRLIQEDMVTTQLLVIFFVKTAQFKEQVR